MKIRILFLSNISAILALILLGIANHASAQSPTTITQWNFNTIGVQAQPYNNPPPTFGVGTAMSLGMSNNYTFGTGVGSVPDSDVTNSKQPVNGSGTKETTFTFDNWRIYAAPNNGWSIYAPQYTQGIEVDTSTVGYSNINFSFNWYSTTYAPRDMQVEYNLNTSNPSGWTSFSTSTAFSASSSYTGAVSVPISPTGTLNANSNNFWGYTTNGGTGQGQVPLITVNLSSVPGANNDPNFGIRLVSAFDSTGNLEKSYPIGGANGNPYAGAATGSRHQFDANLQQYFRELGVQPAQLHGCRRPRPSRPYHAFEQCLLGLDRRGGQRDMGHCHL